MTRRCSFDHSQRRHPLLSQGHLALCTTALSLCCLILSSCTWHAATPPTPSPSPHGTPPVIDTSFIASHTLSHHIFPLYLEAHDVDGDMAGVWITLSQLGVHVEDSHFIPLHNSTRIKGFITIDIPRLETIERLRVEVVVVDREGSRSELIQREVLIGFSPPEPTPDKWKTPDVQKLGHIFFDFFQDDRLEQW